MAVREDHVAVLVERTFEVGVPIAEAWRLLAEVERWPEWAPHIRSARLDGGSLGPGSSGQFKLRPVGSARFQMTAWQPPTVWSWRGNALGLTIDYHHYFAPVGDRTKLTWMVESHGTGRGPRERLFARIYTRNLDRAWPEFVDWAEQETRQDRPSS